MLKLIKTAIGTKFVVRWEELMCRLALDAVRIVAVEGEGGEGAGVGGVGGRGGVTVDVKRYARVEKVPGGEIEESRVLRGVMVNKVSFAFVSLALSGFLGGFWVLGERFSCPDRLFVPHVFSGESVSSWTPIAFLSFFRSAFPLPSLPVHSAPPRYPPI